MGAISGTALATIAAVQAAGTIGGAVIGNIASKKDRDAAIEAQKKAVAEIQKLGAGPDLAREIFLREFKSAGVLTPELEREVDRGVSKIAQIQEDPKLKKAQMEALSAIQERGRTGFTPEELMQLRKERSTAERSAESKRQQILADLRARGALDSGAGVAAQLRSADELALQQSEASDRAAAMASQRALQAITQAGQLGGQIRGQEFDIARTKAGSEEEMQRFNIQNRMSQEQRRAQQATQARQFNLQQQQALMNLNVEQANREAIRRRQAEQAMYENQMDVARLRSGIAEKEADWAGQRAAGTQQAFTQAGQAIGRGAGAILSGGIGSVGAGSGASSGLNLGAVPKTSTGAVDFGLDEDLLSMDPRSYDITKGLP